jgi:Ca-activated chloride channel family protein
MVDDLRVGDNFNESLMVAMARAGGGNHYYGDTAEDLMEPFQQELDLLANLALCQVELSVSTPDGIEVEMLNDLPAAGTCWRLPDLAWGAEAWAVVRLRVPGAALPGLGERLSLLRVTVSGQSLQGEPVALERVGLALPVLTATAFDALPEDELVARRCLEVEAGKVLTQMHLEAQAHDWDRVDGLLASAQARFAGNEWVSSILAAMVGVARSRSRERMMKEARYSSAKLNSRLAAKDEPDVVAYGEDVTSYLRRKPLQGKGDL